MDDSLTITIPTKTNPKTKEKKQKTHNLDGFVEIKKEYLKHLHGSWIKYLCLKTNKLYTGGFLDKIQDNKIYLRCPAKDNFIVDFNGNQFYVKEKNENYMALLDLVMAHQKDIFGLVSYKKKIIKMIQDGEIKFIK